MSTANIRSSFESRFGFDKWKKVEKVAAHQKSISHRISQAFTLWKERERILKSGRGIDCKIERQIAFKTQRCRQILDRILNCIKFLATQNLALRGHHETLSLSASNNEGNFLALVILLSKYDPVLQSHLKHVRSKLKSVSYLSPEIQNEFVHILASAVRNKLLRKE